jgi:hypothetical protein
MSNWTLFLYDNEAADENLSVETQLGCIGAQRAGSEITILMDPGASLSFLSRYAFMRVCPQ